MKFFSQRKRTNVRWLYRQILSTCKQKIIPILSKLFYSIDKDEIFLTFYDTSIILTAYYKKGKF